MFMTWNSHQFDPLHSLVFRGNVNDVNGFRVLECCRETWALPGRNYSLFKYVISLCSSSHPMDLDFLALVSTPLYLRQLPLASLALAGGYAR